jgi:hypothetical protein
VVLDLTFDLRTRGQTESNVKSTTLAVLVGALTASGKGFWLTLAIIACLSAAQRKDKIELVEWI